MNVHPFLVNLPMKFTKKNYNTQHYIMKSIVKNVLALIAFGAALVGFSSCSGEDNRNLIEHVPSDALIVAKFNLRNLALQSGCDVKADGSIELSKDVETLFEHSDVASQTLVNILAINAPYIDSEAMMWFKPGTKDGGIVLFDIKDREGLAKSLADFSVAHTTLSGFSVYAYPECSVLTKGEIGWIARQADAVIEIEKKSDRHFAAFEPVKDFFENESHDIEIAINYNNNVRSDLQYITGFADFKTGGAYAELMFMDAEGNIYQFDDAISTVDRRLLKYIPTKTEALIALGKVNDWDKIFEVVENNAPENLLNEYGPYFAVAKNYLSMIDGTTLFAVAPVAGAQALKQFSLSTWQALMMVHLPAEEIESTISMLKQLLELQGIESRPTSDTNWQFIYEGEKVNFGTVDGYLYVANYDVLNAGNSEFANSYESKQAAFELMIPYGSETMKALNLPWGLDFNIFLSKKHLKTIVRLPGGNGPVLKEIISSMVNSGAVSVVND